jgi:hypothetical protein
MNVMRMVSPGTKQVSHGCSKSIRLEVLFSSNMNSPFSIFSAPADWKRCARKLKRLCGNKSSSWHSIHDPREVEDNLHQQK